MRRLSLRGIEWLNLAVLCAFLIATATAAKSAVVDESARTIPVAYEVDVVVVGGSTGAVAAAETAARAGAKVLLIARHPYLGEDMTATLRLWREPDEQLTTDLAAKIFNDPVRRRMGPHPNRLPYTYKASLPSDPLHKDTTPPSVLNDGRWGDPVKMSVQYNDDVSILADLGQKQDIGKLHIVYYQRNRGGAQARLFIVDNITVWAGDDPQQLKKVTTWTNPKADEEIWTDQTWEAEIPVNRSARYVRLDVKKAPQAERILLGEIEILPPGDTAPVLTEQQMPRPLHIKRVLEQTLLDAGVQFLFGCYPTDVLVDADGKPAGIVMANRAGRQAVIAKTIIDATPRGTVARLAGATFAPFPGGKIRFKRVVIGGQLQEHEGMAGREIPPPFVGPFPNRAKTSSGLYRVFEYTAELEVPEDSPSCWSKVDQLFRTWTYHPEQQFTSDELFFVPPNPVKGETSYKGPLQQVNQLPLGAFKPRGVPFVYILSGSADVPRQVAEKLLRPTRLIELGYRIGEAAAQQARQRVALQGVKLAGKKTGPAVTKGDVKEFLVGVRPVQELPRIAQEARSLPVLGIYDVVVVGGGTSGSPAGIAAARRGAKTLVVEYLYGLGGVGTEGAISSYYWGNRVGFTASIPTGNSWVIEQKKEWFRRQLIDNGAEVWLGTIGCGAFVDGNMVKGVVVATAQGRGVVLAKAVVDATGNADIAAAAGAQCDYTDAREFAMQGTGLPPRELGATYTNTDFTIADETDLVDIWHLLVYAKDKYPEAFDQGRLIDTRERRRIVGDFTMTLADQLIGRTYPDTICITYSNFDTHGYTVDPLLELFHPEKKGYYIHVPYRCLLPRGLEGIIVCGLGTSMHRDAVPMTRMQADLQNQGYAAGYAAAMAAEAGCGLREIDIKKLQEHLVEIGNLPESVLTERDNFPLPKEKIVEAVESLKNDYEGAAVVLSHREEALPLVRKAYLDATDPQHKLIYAHVLAVLGDKTGLPTLIEAVRSYKDWDKGWDYRGMGQFGHALSKLDRLIIALGRTRDPSVIPVILEKAAKLTPESEFSHFRAVGLALELIGDRSAAPALAALLSKPGMTGYVHDTLEKARKHHAQYRGTSAVGPRRDSLRELLLARALYRCGDYGKMGEQILRAYTKDLRGHLARHAKAVLEAGPKPLPQEPR